MWILHVYIVCERVPTFICENNRKDNFHIIDNYILEFRKAASVSAFFEATRFKL